jgi:hypothetical protein
VFAANSPAVPLDKFLIIVEGVEWCGWSEIGWVVKLWWYMILFDQIKEKLFGHIKKKPIFADDMDLQYLFKYRYYTE